MGDGLDVVQLLFLRYLQGCVNSCHHLLTQTGINCCVLNFSCLVLCHCRPWLASIFAWNETWAILLDLLVSTRCPFYAVILWSLRLVSLVVTLSVMMLDSWYFNAKYANYLRDCYDQFLWSLSFSLKWLVWSHFNIIIVWFVTTYPLGFSGRILQFSMFSYLVSYLHILTFLRPLQLVVVVVGFCLNFLSTMLNACVISSF